MEPITTAAAKITIARALWEAAGAAGVSAVAITVTGDEVGIIVTLLTLIVGLVAWAVRIQVTVQNQGDLLARMDRRVEKIADHLGVIE